MADERLVAVLKRDVSEWNSWRSGNEEVRPGVAAANLRGADLSGANLRGADLRGADLREANLRGADLFGANLPMANLIGADLRTANLIGADLRLADLSEATLFRAILCRAYLYRANLPMASLIGADLRTANLIGADLRLADLSGADLSGADLSEASLRGANLRAAVLSGANLTEALLAVTVFADVDLSRVRGLGTVTHAGPSSLGLDTLYRSGGAIPEAFLRGCGVPDEFITYLPSLLGSAINFYSCFISYSSQDEEFARRLNDRLRGDHLRVWFAPEDLKGGDKLHEQIDRAIEIQDRVLVVISDASLASKWVRREVRRAREKEQRHSARVLFPIRLTHYESIDQMPDAALAEELREYYIPDFSNWRDHDAFEAAASRLIRDLRAQQTGAPEPSP